MKYLLCFALVALVSFALADVDESDVLVLNADNFDATIQANPVILVEFYAPWCGHCKRLVPEYAAAATALKGVAPLAKVDADAEENRDLGARFGIRGFPTLKLFRDGNPVDYQGERSSSALVSFMKKQTLPAVSELEDVESVNKFSGEEKVVIVGFFADKSSEAYALFAQTAENLRQSFLFGAVVGKPEVAKEFGVQAPSVVLFKTFDEKKNVLSESFDGLAQFIQTHSVPLIDEVGPQNYKTYAESGLPLGYVFVDLSVDGQKDQYVELVRPFAVSSKGKMNWVYIDWAKYSKHAERLGLSGKVVPSLAIENLEQGTHYAFDETAQITGATVGAWVNQFLAGDLQPTIKSEEIPADNSGPVKVVVAKSFEDIVNDATKDVLVEFYAPWCGHCKQLAPIYEELGQAFKGVPSVVIAKIDATSNDVNPKLGIRGFPTLKLFPANNKNEPIDYQGDRSKADLIQFVQDNASVKFDASSINLDTASDEHADKDEL
jgi:protein disulfide-isomerase A1